MQTYIYSGLVHLYLKPENKIKNLIFSFYNQYRHIFMNRFSEGTLVLYVHNSRPWSPGQG
jgi:hypothetical protein